MGAQRQGQVEPGGGTHLPGCGPHARSPRAGQRRAAELQQQVPGMPRLDPPSLPDPSPRTRRPGLELSSLSSLQRVSSSGQPSLAPGPALEPLHWLSGLSGLVLPHLCHLQGMLGPDDTGGVLPGGNLERGEAGTVLSCGWPGVQGCGGPSLARQMPLGGGLEWPLCWPACHPLWMQLRGPSPWVEALLSPWGDASDAYSGNLGAGGGQRGSLLVICHSPKDPTLLWICDSRGLISPEIWISSGLPLATPGLCSVILTTVP